VEVLTLLGSLPDRRAFCLAAAALAAGAGCVRPARGAQDPDLAAAVKATYLHKFAPFVKWPAGAFAAADSPYVICVMGDDGFQDLVRRAVAGQTVGGRPFNVHSPATIEQAQRCHILYLGSAGFAPSATVIEALRGQPVLTVTDAASGTSSGVVHFLLDAGRVRFEIDARLAQLNGIEISSRVLELALRVKRAESQGPGRLPS